MSDSLSIQPEITQPANAGVNPVEVESQEEQNFFVTDNNGVATAAEGVSLFDAYDVWQNTQGDNSNIWAILLM